MFKLSFLGKLGVLGAVKLWTVVSVNFVRDSISSKMLFCFADNCTYSDVFQFVNLPISATGVNSYQIVYAA